MLYKFTPRAKQILALARRSAIGFRHSSIGAEHLLVGLVWLGDAGGGVARDLLKSHGLDLETLHRLIHEKLPEGLNPISEDSKILFQSGFKSALERAYQEARQLGHSFVGTEHILLGLIHDPGIAGNILRSVSLNHIFPSSLIAECMAS